MPVLAIGPEPQKVYLPSTAHLESEDDKAWVVFDVSPAKAGDIASLEQGMAGGLVGLSMVAERIQEWNYTDSQGVTVPINTESVKSLHIDDFKYLSELIPTGTGLDVDQKKTLNPTSPQPETDV